MAKPNLKSHLGHVHYLDATGASVEVHGAVWCENRDEFDQAISAYLKERGSQFLWSEEVHDALGWLRKFGHNGQMAGLARKVDAKAPVALSDPKVVASNAPEEDGYLKIDEIEGVEPLDMQFGVYPKLTVPAALQDAMFGQPDPTEAEIEQHGENVPPMQTYAILDAAKLPYLLTGLLEASGCEYQSLFQGEAQKELGEHAPYIVRLEDGNDFTRKLFTDLEPPLGLWPKELGIFMRSRATLPELRKHFRKFTRVQNKDGKWYYFRFWDAKHIARFLRSTSIENAKAMFGHSVFQYISYLSYSKTFSILSFNGVVSDAPSSLHITNSDIEIFSEVRIEKYSETLKSWLEESYGQMRGIPSEKTSQFLKEQIYIAQDKIGLNNEKVITEYVATSWLLEKSAYEAPELNKFQFSKYYDKLHEIHLYALSIRNQK